MQQTYIQTNIISADQIKDNEMARTCGHHEKNLKERDCLEDPAIDGRILKWKKYTGWQSELWIHLAEGRSKQ
jgi:hypothetical protein